MPMTHDRPAAYAGLPADRQAVDPVPPKRGVEFRFQEFLDEAANAGPHLEASKGSNRWSPRKSVPSAASPNQLVVSVFMA